MAECSRCGETVYAADRAESSTGVFHKACFTCEVCKCKLNAAILREKDGLSYCNRCVNKAGSKPASSPAASAAPPPVVHAAPAHQSPAWAAVANSGDIGTRVKASEDSALDEDDDDNNPRPAAKPVVVKVAAPSPAAPSPVARTPAAQPAPPPAAATEGAGPAAPKGESSAKALAARFGAMAVNSPVPAPAPSPAPRAAPAPSPAPAAAPSSSSAPAVPLAKPSPKPQGKAQTIGQIIGGNAPCPRCGKAVYMAEKVIGPGGDWHKACLSCIECKKTLNSGSLAEHKGEAYCKPCHDKAFGPKGYGFAQGGATTMRTS